MSEAEEGKRNKPCVYSHELVDKICEQIATSKRGLHWICRQKGMPAFQTIFRWMNDEDKVYLREQYARAKDAQADFLREEIIDISDCEDNDIIETEDGGYRVNHDVINRDKLRVDSRKWVAARLAPKKYGDKLDVTTDGEKINNIAQPEIKIYTSAPPLAKNEGDINSDK